MDRETVKLLEQQNLLGTYGRPDFVVSHGKGVYLYDTDGKKYLDFIAGIAVNGLGHADPELLSVMNQQAQKLIHCSNLYSTTPQAKLAKLLVDNSFADKVFFCNSGTEAIEGAIKFARKWAFEEKNVEVPEIIVFKNSFHGRTMGALSATGQNTLWQGFGPMLQGFQFAKFNNVESVSKLVNSNTCAILVEPIQGEGGIYPADISFIQDVRKLCDNKNLLMVVDEIQCGVGRTGKLFAHEHYGFGPDIMTIAKPLANGLPLGAVLVTDNVAEHIKPGNHGSTFGGGPLVTKVAEYVFKRINQPAFLKHVQDMGVYIVEKLEKLRRDFPAIIFVRGLGLMIGIEFEYDPKDIVADCIKNGLLVVKTSGNTFRFLPPLVIEKSHVDEAINILEDVLKSRK
jgi:acetylornithine/N-succinyldiaminopimelate aminotransferase